jgi:hypothetical protein
VVFLAGVGFRYIELGLLAALVVSTGLLFFRRRPAILTFWGVLVMAALAVHLFLERDRWQMIPAYLLLFVLAIWLSLPSRRRYGAMGLLARIVLVILALFAVAIPVFAPLFPVPSPAHASSPDGERSAVGTAAIFVGETESGSAGAQVRMSVWYPTDEPTSIVAPFWRGDDAGTSVPGFHPLFSSHLSLVPTPAYVRAPVVGERLPVLLILPDATWLPGDHLSIALAAASAGWFVAELPRDVEPQRALAQLSELTTGVDDAAITGRLSRNRVAVLGSRRAAELGLPSVIIADGSVQTRHADGTGTELFFPESTVPDLALSDRYRFVLVPGLLIGSSDVPPARAEAAARRFVTVVLGQGTLEAPIFGGTMPAADELLSSDVPGALRYRSPDTGQ